MAKKAAEGKVKVRVLSAGWFDGIEANVDDVIELSSEAANRHAEQSSVDTHPDAVAYAESLVA